ncbi:Protein BREAKING OF ASYMMETRY IN THE STOMATAL LINEAGE [Bienertia sinuspersici]
MPPPSSITYMGPVAYSGNISLRSESSAGSTRSFAFPVLQAEWNSSPVRMAKADQGHFRKQRGWVHSLVCCKF